MAALSQILGTLIGFATVMLTASLVVMAVVRTVHYLADKRGKTLGEMLAALNQGYRLTHGDAAAPGDEAETAFVLDVLTYPTLHLPSEVAALGRPGSPGSPAGLVALRRKLSLRVEYISEGDLLAIVRTLCGESGQLAPHWHRNLPREARQMERFAEYVTQWFRTLEGVSTEQFKRETRTLTAVVSCIVVVALNMDGLQLASALYQNTELQQELARRAPDVLALAEQRESESDANRHAGRDALLEGVSGDLAQANGLLNEPGLRLGWHDSAIARSWCEACREGSGLPPRTAGQWVLDVARWLAGLLFSCIMLSLGAPFWIERLREVLNLQNSVQARRRSQQPAKPER